MTKTQKLRDKQLHHVLTLACEQIKNRVSDFDYLTHTVDFKHEANSLHVSCFFIDGLALSHNKHHYGELNDIIIKQLSTIRLSIKPSQISFLAK
jgi:hypothetical protein